MSRVKKKIAASYLRAVAVAFSTIQITEVVAKVPVAFIGQLGITLLGALVAPTIYALTTIADELDHEEDSP